MSGAPSGDFTAVRAAFLCAAAGAGQAGSRLLDAGRTTDVGLRSDEYRCFVIPRHTEDKWVTGMDFPPGNRGIVHHIIRLSDLADARGAQRQGSGPGYKNPTPQRSADFFRQCSWEAALGNEPAVFRRAWERCCRPGRTLCSKSTTM